MNREAVSTNNDLKVFLIGVQSPLNKTDNIQSYYDEFISLAKTNQIHDYESIFVKIRSIDTKYFFTKGKLEEIRAAFEESGASEVVISEQLSGQQERNLKDLFDCRVFDRTRLILSIFEQAAITAEGKTQVEIANLEFQKTRLAGHGIHLSQQAGMIGVRGPGETLKEQTTRHIERGILKLKEKLKKIEKSRAVQRKRRLANKVPQICLVGYTNAGKSTILNLLTHSDVLAEDKLFATLDTTTRQLFINHEKQGVISDTVGFIQNLPHQLIKAFQSTLSELQYADLLLHVVDISNNNWKSHINVVLDTLDDIDVHKEMLFVFNKSDLLEEEELKNRLNEFGLFAPYVVVNCTSKENLLSLQNYLAAHK